MKIFISLGLLLSLFSAVCAQEVPAVYSNVGSDENGVFLKIEDRKIYAITPKDKFQYEDLYTAAIGTKAGLTFNFKYPELQGTLYYGFINYKDGSYPQPVYFRESSPIKVGITQIPIKNHLSGKFDMINWEETGKGILGFRIVSDKGNMLYDGRVAFSYKDGLFAAEPTVIEGPFINLLNHQGATISFTTSAAIQASIQIGDRTYQDKKAVKNHEIKIDDLQANKNYQYTLKVGEFNFDFSLETAPMPGSRKTFTFAYGSDSRAGNGGGERNVFGANVYIMKRIAAVAKAENAKFMQFTGDLINGYETSRERMNLQYANWKHAVEPFWHHMPFVAGFGNHEAYNYIFKDSITGSSYLIDHFPFDNESGESLFQENFVLPQNGPKSEDNSIYDPNPDKVDFPSYKESVYWYTYDNVALVALNSDYFYAPSGLATTSGNLHAYIMDNQLKWLQKTLKKLEKNKNIDHVFVTIHTPFFPNGGHVKDDMWYNGSNQPRAFVNGLANRKGIIERRDQLLNLIVNKSKKTVAIMSGDEHNYNLLTITDEMQRYPENYPHKKLKLDRTFYQINNGAAGAPYYAQEETPWSANVSNFSTQNAIVLIDVDGTKINVRVKNPDTLELIDEYSLRD
ncbi:metallophosphoesterase [Labilibaculum sp. DW002]|uniref:Metallophosphoesterase n=1 Tax=Paralabilibaculum antarcticum TaxID=2912572 RepID=A0ABT5VSW3_9BACT|nr:metallophosphoesterase [Labilibaculum sp. DW002]MDE5418511.1 metallophosphoesterase [Labilibaculum sp. DW002]